MIGSLIVTVTVLACPLCQDIGGAVEGSDAVGLSSRTVHGYALSLIALLGFPVMMIVGFTILILRSVRRHRSAGHLPDAVLESPPLKPA